ncbi:hydantoinase B/oxoprolinase family protein [uncultured Ruegeria sp.]|uniref:hydantoinase B/oxoprolinase family protein n=1 Tax=uncultured Ruegeria sp. TaxID=259304 RepID=UPI00261B64A1|nr:hydantoinase B/oxoprolinase family protein [uncultured Ruegeria sp.]
MKPSDQMKQVQLQIMWDRLIAVVEEQAQTLIRTAFSTSTREAGDVSAGVYNTSGDMLAQAVTGTPGHVNAMAESVKHFVADFAWNELTQGDVLITNDPWKGTGHLHDFTVVTPIFRDGRPIAIFACTTHVVDIGGLGFVADGREVYEEGFYIPPMFLARAGTMNDDLLGLVRANVREPAQVEGDLYSLAACNEAGGRRLLEMMTEYGLEDIEDLGQMIIDSSRKAMQDAIRELPNGSWTSSMTTDGYEADVTLCATLTIEDEKIRIDFDGTSGESSYGINVPLSYTKAYGSFGLRCVIGNKVPNNAGSLGAIEVTAPLGTIVNARPPRAVCARHVIGQMLPDVVYGCLHQAVEGMAPAEGTSSIWAPILMNAPENGARTGEFTITMFNTGGTGARPTKDGLNCTAFPSGIRNVPVEISETMAPIVLWRKDFRQDSGGPGKFRGGAGQIIEASLRSEDAFAFSAMFDRVNNPPRGRADGGMGLPGEVVSSTGTQQRVKGKQVIPAGQRLVLKTPGGGGYGAAFERDPAYVVEDVRLGFITIDTAARDYGVVLYEDLKVNEAETARLRADASA